MQCRLFLDVVVGQSTTILKLLSSKDQTLLVWWNTFLILDLGFNIIDGVAWFNLECDGFTSQRLDKDLHTTTKSQNKMEG